MEPENNRFGGGVAETVMHPTVAAVMLLLVILVLCLSRKRALVPLLLGVFLIPMGQVLVVGVHFTPSRILVLAGAVRILWTRVTSAGSSVFGGVQAVDKAVVLWALSYATTYMLLYPEQAAIVNRLGFLVDAGAGYVLVRFLIRDYEDVERAIKTFVIIAVVMAACMLNEQVTQRNVFGLLGGHPALASFREGHIRSQGVFAHPLLAGSFGAVWVPLFVYLLTASKSRLAGLLGTCSALIVVVTAWSSTPLLTTLAGVAALCCWPIRRRMRLVRVATLVTLIGLHLVMKAPVWFLIDRIGIFGASSGYHRAMLVDNFIRRFDTWWLIGTRDYDKWGWSMWDTSNSYVAQGLNGGLLTFGCFVAIIALGFRALGVARKSSEGTSGQEWLFWSLGASLFAHCVAFFGISYFDQSQLSWLTFLAMICAAVAQMQTAAASRQAPVQPAKSHVTKWGFAVSGGQLSGQLRAARAQREGSAAHVCAGSLGVR